jgi:hypothetical protein
LKASTPSGPAEVDSYSITQSNFTTSGAPYAETYLWMLEPSGAGTISSGATEMTCTVDWNTSFSGTATLKVYGVNDCGISELAAEKMINVYNSTGIGEGISGVSLEIFPNPNDGSFVLKIVSENEQRANLTVNNAFGTTVWEKEDVILKSEMSFNIELEKVSEGIYLLNVETDKGMFSRKIMINR